MKGKMALWDDVTLTVEREVIPVSTRGHHIPSPRWVMVDSHGHKHRFAEDGTLPTLDWVVTGTYWCDTCCDEHEEGEWRCRKCGDVIEPQYGWSGEQTINVPGLTTVTVTVGGATYYLSPDDLSALTFSSREELAEKVRALIATRDPDVS